MIKRSCELKPAAQTENLRFESPIQSLILLDPISWNVTALLTNRALCCRKEGVTGRYPAGWEAAPEEGLHPRPPGIQPDVCLLRPALHPSVLQVGHEERTCLHQSPGSRGEHGFEHHNTVGIRHRKTCYARLKKRKKECEFTFHFLTAFQVDLSHIYGDTLERQHKLRLMKDGKMRYQVWNTSALHCRHTWTPPPDLHVSQLTDNHLIFSQLTDNHLIFSQLTDNHLLLALHRWWTERCTPLWWARSVWRCTTPLTSPNQIASPWDTRRSDWSRDWWCMPRFGCVNTIVCVMSWRRSILTGMMIGSSRPLVSFWLVGCLIDWFF